MGERTKKTYMSCESLSKTKNKIPQEKCNDLQKSILRKSYIQNIERYIKEKNDKSDSVKLDVNWELDSSSRVLLHNISNALPITDFISDSLFRKSLNEEIIVFWEYISRESNWIPILEYKTIIQM